ncbi:hypothetical protein ABW20_dc0108458 [Dactylellina cionopaga]|nr:hypothetical protein ABW20_dc0108458 [Dactylellina cionopaga]
MNTTSTSRLAGRVLSTTCAKRVSPLVAAISPTRSRQHSLQYNRSISTTRQLRLSYTPTRFTNPPPPSSATSAQPEPQSRPLKTYYTLFPQTLASGPPPSGPFHIDTRALRTEFLKRQQSTHPDLFPPSSRKQAETASAHLNRAYSALLSPLTRAEYLLTLRGYIDPSSDETSKVEDVELITDVMEANEILESARSEEDLVELREVNEGRIVESIERIAEAFRRDELEIVKGEVVRLRYWSNVAESLRHWEVGKPVVLQH